MAPFETMLVVTTVAGLVTSLGAVPVLLGARVSHRVYDASLGLAGGIMVAASVGSACSSETVSSLTSTRSSVDGGATAGPPTGSRR